MVFASLRDRIARLLKDALVSAQVAGALPAFDVPESIPMAQGRYEAHGDYSSPIAMSLARSLHQAPLQIARALLPHISPVEYISEVEVAPPGFINFTLNEAWLAQQVPVIVEAGESWGALDLGAGRRVQVEFVSANPTGPITIGSARNAVIGDSLASVFEAAGYAVEREYYVNDAGSKVRKFGASILSRYGTLLGATIPFPEIGRAHV